MNGDDYVLDGDLAFSNTKDALKFYQTKYRQQQAEIEALKKEAALQRLSDFTQEADNEPVAWIDPRELDMAVSTSVTKHKQFDTDIPLYTHPAKELDEQFKKGFEAGKEEGWKAHKFHHPAKTLTDEEIRNIANETNLESGIAQWKYDFARAILRKAQEK